MNSQDASETMAVFLDLENMVLGAKRADFPMFNVRKVLERLLAKGSIVVKKAYCDFTNYKDFKRPLHSEAFEMVEIPHLSQSGKNSADIRMVVDALDLCYRNDHVDTFVIVSGDSDFSPLVSKLRENAKKVIGVGVKQSTSDLFIHNCDEFIYYDDLVRAEMAKKRPAPAPVKTPPSRVSAPAKTASPNVPGRVVEKLAAAKSPALSVEKAMEELMLTVDVLRGERGADQIFHAGMLKNTMKRRNPGFDERAHGFRSFSELLREAEKRGLVKLDATEQSGGLRVLPGE
jgi:uncharacterized protein (TIGR00288 family)